MWHFSHLGDPTKVKTCSASKGTGPSPTHSQWNLPNEIKTVSSCRYATWSYGMVYKIWPEKSHHIAMVTEISLLTALCSLIMWLVNLGLGYISKCTSHFRLFPELPSCVIWSCAVSFFVSSRFLLHLHNRLLHHLHLYLARAGTWYCIFLLLLMEDIDYRRILCSSSYYRKIFGCSR